MQGRQFVIGDIHGCARTLDYLLKYECMITLNDKIYFLGDYIDRGPDSKGVVDIILSLKDNGYHVECLMGNHEEMLLESTSSKQNHERWLNNGAKTTLASFGITNASELSPRYHDFFNGLYYYLELDHFILVHAGLNFKIEDPFSDMEAMLWSRSNYVDLEKTKNKPLIVGHTPVPLRIILDTIKNEKILLDGGCIYHGIYEGFGYLCALELNSMRLFYVPNIESRDN